MPKSTRGGRPAIPVNQITVERIKRLRAQHKETQAQIAEVAHCTKITVARWEKGTRGVDSYVLQQLADHWGVLPAYLTGETDIVSDPVAFRLEQENKIIGGFTAAIENHEYNIRRARLDNLFSYCGFTYHDAFDSELLHTLSDESGIVRPTTFNDTELNDLLAKIKALIELECYRKSIAQNK